MRLFLGIFFVVSFLVVFVMRTLLVWRSTGVNPVIVSREDDADRYIMRTFLWVEVALVISLAAFIGGREGLGGTLPPLEHDAVRLAGLALVLLSTLWAAIAQAQMGASWRIGIDRERQTALVTHGLFGVSRNPIFFGMRVALVGYFLCVPSVLMLAVLLVGHVLISVQVRLEEAHLASSHGEAYAAYRKRVRRWV